jgi:hypothetical protein
VVVVVVSSSAVHKRSREGDFAGVRRLYKWRAGRYTLKLRKMRAEIVNAEPCVWVGASVLDRQSGKEIDIGALAFPAGRLLLAADYLGSFVELYVPLDPALFPSTSVAFGEMVINGNTRPIHARVARSGNLPALTAVKYEQRVISVHLGRVYSSQNAMDGETGLDRALY